MASSKLDIIIQAQDRASKVLSSIGKQTTDLHKSVTDLGHANDTTGTKVQGLTGSFIKAGAALGAITIAANLVGSAISKAFEVGADVFRSASAFEQSAIAFEVMLGSADKARTMLKDVSRFAANTPFELPELIDTTKRLLAYNIAAEDIIPTLTSLGNITAGIGRDKLPQLILAYGQVRAATKLTGAELRQFSEAGVPLIEQLAKQFGVAEARILEMVSAGEIGFPAVRQAFMEMSGEGGKFFNLMERQSLTFDGVVSNLRDNFMSMGREIIGMSNDGTIREGSIFQTLSNAAQNLLKWVDANRQAIENYGRGLMDGLVNVFNAHVMPLLQRFADWLTNPAYAAQRQQWIDKMAEFVRSVATVAIFGGQVIVWASNMIGSMSRLYGYIKPVVDLLNVIQRLNPMNIYNSAVMQGLKWITGRATGGVIRPGETTLVGERGPEIIKAPGGSKVFTNQQSQQMMSGGFTINGLTINNYTPNTNGSIMADLGWEISRRIA